MEDSCTIIKSLVLGIEACFSHSFTSFCVRQKIFFVCVFHWIKAVIVWHRPLNVDRFGVSVVANIPLDEEADATSNAAVGIARAFHFIASDKDPRQALDWLLQVTHPFQICYVLVHLKQEAWFFPKEAFCERFQTWGLFLESPETFRAYFGWHNSLCIFKTKASRGTKPCSYFYFYSLYNIWKDQLYTISRSQFYKWLFGPEKSSGLSRNARQDFKSREYCVRNISSHMVTIRIGCAVFTNILNLRVGSLPTWNCKYAVMHSL
mgnify:CR=1 FL=1